VTVADKAAEDAMRELIQAQYPAHGILGEEHGAAVAAAR
jgi:myo-inositol-1(or 4)-monophosphatase